MAKLIAITILLLYASRIASGIPVRSDPKDVLSCPPGYTDMIPSSEKCYFISDFDDYKSWTDSYNACENMINCNDYEVECDSDNSGLVSIDSNQENNELFDQLSELGIQAAWIGLSYDQDKFMWNNDPSNSPSYFHWAPGGPDLNPDGTNYAQLAESTNAHGAVAGKWLVPDDQTVANYICQAPKVSQSSTTPWFDKTTTENWWDPTTTQPWWDPTTTEPWWDPTTTPSWKNPTTTEPWWDPTTTPSWKNPTTTEPWWDPTTTEPWWDPTTTPPWWDPTTTEPWWDPTTTEPWWDPTTTPSWWDPTTTEPWWDPTTTSQWSDQTTTPPWWEPTTTEPWWDPTTTEPWYETTTSSSSELVCMEGYEDVYPTYDKCYYFSTSDDLKSWEDAFEACDDMMNWEADVEYDSLNCHLLSIDSADQHTAITNRLKNSDLQSAWIGLSYTVEGNWTWNSDDTEAYPSYFNWEHGQPNLNLSLDVNYAAIEQYSNSKGTIMGKWIVPDDQSLGNYICQSPKVPLHPPTSPTTPPWDPTTTPSDVGMECMEGFEDLVEGTGKCYYISTADELKTWDDAEGACAAMIDYSYGVDYTPENTKLVVLNSDDENNQLFNQLLELDIDSVWIGLSGSGYDDWSWNNDYNDVPTYFNWAENEPSINPDAAINYVQLMQGYDNGMDYPTGKWFVPQDQTEPGYYVCQAPKVPTNPTTLNPETSTPNQDLTCMPGYQDLVENSGKCYYFSSSENIRTRQEAVAVCDKLMDFGYDGVDYNPENTQLVSISSDYENDALFNEMYYSLNIQSAWIGLSWNDYSNWTWNEDASNPPSYFNWADGEPNEDTMNDQSFGKLMADFEASDEPTGKWYVPDDQFAADYFICQSPKVPDTPMTTPSNEMVCMPGYQDMVEGSDKCYLIYQSEDINTWDQASYYCDSQMSYAYSVDYNTDNTKLVTIASDDENNQLFQQMYNSNIQAAWIGLSWNDDVENWIWNGDEADVATYTSWAEGEPVMNPYPDTNNAQLQQDYSTGGDEPIGTWLIPGDQIDSYTFICQSPKVPKSEISSTTPGWDTTTSNPWWDPTTTSPWWDPTTTNPWWDPTTTEPWWDPTTTPHWWDPTTSEPWWDTTTSPPWWDPTTTPPWWDPTTTEPWWDTTTSPPWWDPTTTPPWWDPTTTEPWWETTTSPPWWDPTTTQPWWDPTTTEPWWDTTTSPPWWDPTTTQPWWDPTTTAEGSMTCMDGYADLVPTSGKCYYLSMYDEDMKTWEDAKDACSNRTNWNYQVNYNNENTLLVAIDSQEENDDLWNTLSEWGADSAWIGLSWNYGGWSWNDDPTNPPGYFNWAEGEPNVNPDAPSNYVLLKQDDNSGGENPTGTWIVPDSQDDENYYICQSPKVPVSDKTTPFPDATTTEGPLTTSSEYDDMICMDGFEDWIPGSEKCYFISYNDDDQLSWDDASEACIEMTNWDYSVDYNSLNTNLISITSDDENNELYEQLSDLGIDSVWIGLQWSGSGWTWNQDSTYTPTYTSWAEGEPNVDPDRDTNYVQASADDEMMTATWMVPDAQTNPNYYICQSPKVPRSQITTPNPFDPTTVPPTVGSCMKGYDDVVPSSSKCYMLKTVESPVTWEEASSLCNDMMNWNYKVEYTSSNTQLVTIDSDEQNNLLSEYLSNANIQSAWIGLSWSSNKNWTWNANPLFKPSYTDWGQDEPNLSPVVDPQYVKMQQNSDPEIGGNWFVNQDVTLGHTNFICQSPKIPNVSSAASPLINQIWLTMLVVVTVYILVNMMI